jgi:hypothetical protein
VDDLAGSCNASRSDTHTVEGVRRVHSAGVEAGSGEPVAEHAGDEGTAEEVNDEEQETRNRSRDWDDESVEMVRW